MVKRIVSGVQPSGKLTIGNYLGAIKSFVKLQEEFSDAEFFFFVADLHAITVAQDRLKLRQHIREVAAMYIACGLDPEKVNIFIQSEVPAHNQLGYIMESTAYIGEMERMTQYKDKRIRQVEGIKTSLLTYPALMAADILLYDADLVPIGDDQNQHLELTRVLGERFNNQYGKTFEIPKAYYNKEVIRIKSLADPLKKMSKSDEVERSYILLIDEDNRIRNKIGSAVTDSDTKIYYDEANKPGISNLLSIYSGFSEKPIPEIEQMYQNKSYQEFKVDLGNLIVNYLKPIKDKYEEILKSKYLDDVLDRGRNRATIIANRKLERVYHRVGLGRKK
ncbi:MAG: tryptophan--tRNA ligase [Acholeplasmataceae bacterium]|jgi:tryptophanyl-tRNA synthetase